MQVTMAGMTLKDLLRQYGILAASELRRRILDEDGQPKLSRAQAWNLWSGKVGVGKETMRLLHDQLGISYDELMGVDTVPAPKRPSRKANEGQAHE
jgi:transcriptional regulator with XRE-family HTH domain